ncbi:MAG: carboxypeptidase M32 [Clostridia bacterium]|nr:carboxypeptidase M32 [Clostridia bacterium]
MELKTAVERVKELQELLHAYDHAMGVIGYELSTIAPKLAYIGASKTQSILAAEQNKHFINDEVRELLTFLDGHKAELDEQTAAEVRELLKNFRQTELMPREEIVEYRRFGSEIHEAWKKARESNDYASYAPLFDKQIEWSLKIAGYANSKGMDTYDFMLDDFEEGFTTEVLDPFFDAIRAEIVPLIRDIQTRGREIDDSFLHKEYPVEGQRRLGEYIMELMGLTRDVCTLEETVHPFSNSFNNKDSRMTTRYVINDLASSLYSVIHEGGHSLHSVHAADSLNGSAAAGASNGMCESMSRFQENIVGRSREFCEFLFPKVQEIFPEQLAGVSAEQFWLAVNKVKPDLIRTEADELTYCLHIMVRYELEKRIIAGTLKAADLPAEWNRLYKEYLGVDVPDDARGVLQDIHWVGGGFGYFPSYAIGNAYGAQILTGMLKEIDLFADLRRGDLSREIGWLREHVYQYGGVRKAVQIIPACSGEKFDVKYYIDYLKNKYTEIYGL